MFHCTVHMQQTTDNAPPRGLLSFSYLKLVEDLGDKPTADADARSRASVARAELRTLELYAELKQWGDHHQPPAPTLVVESYREIKSVTKFKETLTNVRGCLVV